MSIEIDGLVYNVPIKALHRKADFLDKYAERVDDGTLQRELIGVFFNYELEFGTTTDTAEYNRLWDKLSEPEEFHTVSVPDGNSTLTFQAYFAGVNDDLYRVDREDQTFYKNLKANFIARSPART
jgi:hypothetical protein